MRPSSPARIVVRGTNWIGDAVMTIPALRELRRIFPESHLTLLVRPWVAGLFESAAYVDELLAPEPWESEGIATHLRLRRALADREFDAAILFPNRPSAAVLVWAARIPVRIGYATRGRSLLLTHPIPLTSEVRKGFQLFLYLHLVSEIEKRLLGQDTVRFDGPQCRIELRPEDLELGRKKLEGVGVDVSRLVVALVPGSTNSHAKRWLPERFAEVAGALADRFGAQSVLIGASGDDEVGRRVARAAKKPLVNLIAKASLRETLAILARCSLVISNDTGPAHLAAALRRPVLTIFGPTDFNSIRPYSDTAEIIRHPVECAPCMLRDCPIDHRCMTRITSAMVLESAAKMLEATLPVPV